MPENMHHDVFHLQVMEQLLRLTPGIGHIFVIVRSRPGLSGEILYSSIHTHSSSCALCNYMGDGCGALSRRARQTAVPESVLGACS